MKRYLVVLLLSALAGAAMPVFAAEAGAGYTRPGVSDESVGDMSRGWLELQREGEQASEIQQDLPPGVQDLIYGRYLDSFRHPIPDTFYSRDRFREGR